MKRLIIIAVFLPFIICSQPNYNITINTNPYPENLFFHNSGSTGNPVNILDTSGVLIFSDDWGLKGWDFKVNYSNKLTYFDRDTKGWFVMNAFNNVVDSVYCQNGYIADNHDFLSLPNGNYVLLAYDEKPYAMDTIVAGGDPNALVEGLIIQELDSNHNLLFQWSSWDYFSITDNITLDLTSSSIPFIHANSIDIDYDGHFLISSRNLDEITKIHRSSGEIIWRWGGSQNQFTNLSNDYPFTRQHCLRSLGNNKYILFDNGNFSSQYTGLNKISRAVEYLLDTNLMTVQKIWEYIHPDSLYSPSISSVQRLHNGNTLINYGNLQHINLGSIICEVETNNQIVFHTS